MQDGKLSFKRGPTTTKAFNCLNLFLYHNYLYIQPPPHSFFYVNVIKNKTETFSAAISKLSNFSKKTKLP